MVGLRIRQGADGNPAALLLAVQAGIVAFRLVERDPARIESPGGWRALAWLSVLLPLGFVAGGDALVTPWISGTLLIGGLAVTVWALLSLGRSFGVAPADRGLVERGAYRFLRHPAYLGESATYVGFLLGNAQLWNLAVLVVIALTQVLRLRQEERCLAGYEGYAGTVRWRMLPGIW